MIHMKINVIYTMLTVVVVNLAKEKQMLILFLDTVVLIVGQPRRTLIVLVQQMTGKILLRQDVRQRSSQPGGSSRFSANWKMFLLSSLLHLNFCRLDLLTLILIV